MDENIELKLPNEQKITVENDKLILIDSNGEHKVIKGKKEELRMALYRLSRKLLTKKHTIICVICGAEKEVTRVSKEPTCSDKCRKQKQYLKEKNQQD